jgi:hypothetical protein
VRRRPLGAAMLYPIEGEVLAVKSAHAESTGAGQRSWSRSLCVWLSVAALCSAAAIVTCGYAVSAGLTEAEVEADPRPIRLMLDGQLLPEDITAVVVNGVLMVPVAPLVDALGGEFEYDVENGLAVISFATHCLAAEPGPSSQHATEGGAILVFVAKSGDRYHLQGCRYLSSGGEAITLDAAEQRGYLPCKVCNPQKRSLE